MNKPAIIFSAFLSAIVLTIIGGVVYTVRGAEPDPVIQAAPAVAVEQAFAIDPGLEQELLAREAAYQELIAQANTRLAEQQAEVVAQVSTPTAVVLQITAGEAAVFASNHLGQTRIYSVESVDFNGKVVYKVTFSTGDIVYVSPYGDIVSVELASREPDPQPQSVARSAPSGGGEQEHEGGDDD